MHKPSFCPDSRLSFQMMWKQQPALLPPTWSPRAPSLQCCCSLLAPGALLPLRHPCRGSASARGLLTAVFMPAQPLASPLSMPSRGSLVVSLVKLLWLQLVQHKAGAERASNRHPRGKTSLCHQPSWTSGRQSWRGKVERASVRSIHVHGSSVPAPSATHRHCLSSLLFFRRSNLEHV